MAPSISFASPRMLVSVVGGTVVVLIVCLLFLLFVLIQMSASDARTVFLRKDRFLD
jgi:hypothetical protein